MGEEMDSVEYKLSQNNVCPYKSRKMFCSKKKTAESWLNEYMHIWNLCEQLCSNSKRKVLWVALSKKDTNLCMSFQSLQQQQLLYRPVRGSSKTS